MNSDDNKSWMRAAAYGTLFVRFSVGLSFLSAVADRFGVWGAYGQPHVAWGNFHRFTIYTGTLLWFFPVSSYSVLAWTATVAETVFGAALVLGFFTRTVALLSGFLLFLFALTMSFSLGVKAALDLSVFSASAGAFLLAAYGQYPWSLDALRSFRSSEAIYRRDRFNLKTENLDAASDKPPTLSKSANKR